MDASAAKRPYHHGDLRPALLRAVRELLAEQGIERLSLRECARRAGVSWSAPAHHFRNKPGLLAAFAAEGFDELRASMERRRDAETDPAARMAATGAGYVEFALRHPEHFRVMFRTELLDPASEEYREAGRRAYETLENAMRAADAARGVAADPASLRERCLLAWSTVHGYAALVLEGSLAPPGAAGEDRVAEALALCGRIVARLGPALLPPR